MYFIVCYDISNDKRRRKVAGIIKDYGVRVQYSIFECDLSDEKYDELYNRLIEVVKANKDSINIYFLCERCLKNKISLGKEKRFSIRSDVIII
ncbi:CRISPR-associated endonuclease Cas2 [Halanaerobium congolense]|jgi:CRISPR-associated protein Cas2|uniref:CRISPR-associated endoribonuclease Cas2 n=1 Tax=Halanaerobium congolense TaxID=54121 RepID=A0A1G6SA42_9FIRM|nr:CRISPR-associated endonuclease Cas2 [Halanaerobium congolense]SDD12987.1 CRISPR-associated protein, Cas2 family [Halanaerobium congolense]SHN09850.1 CRISPR-associated protein, Cas2 family [Halanaerobium congolense]